MEDCTRIINRIKVGDLRLFISGKFNLRSHIARHRITHVISVLPISRNEEWFIDNDRHDVFRRVNHMVIPVSDKPTSDLLQFFNATNDFLREAHVYGGRVLVHCAAGISRSATICIAYLLSRFPQTLTPSSALELLQYFRPICNPNLGFMEQLKLWQMMGYTKSIRRHPLYRDFRGRRDMALANDGSSGGGPIMVYGMGMEAGLLRHQAREGGVWW